MQKTTKIILLIILAGILIRLGGIGDVLYSAEYDMTNKVYFTENSIPHMYIHPPFAISLYTLSSLFIPGAIGYRIVSLLFWLVSVYLVYLIAKEFFDKDTALYSVLLMVFTYPMVNFSLRVDYVIVQITLFLAITYFLLKYVKTDNLNYAILCGIAIGLSLMVNYSSAFFALLITLFLYYKRKDKVKWASDLLIVGGIAFGVLGLLFLIVSFFEPEIFLRTLTLGNKFSIVPNPMVYVYLLIYVGPLLVGLFIKSLFMKKPKYYSFFIMWIVLLLASITFTNPYEMVDRYVVLIVPALCLLGGWVLAKSKIRWGMVLIYSVIWFAIIFSIQYSAHSVPVGIANYINEIKQLNLNFILPFTGRTGPMFGISFLAIILSVVASLFFLIATLKKKRGIGFTLFVTIALAFNVLIVQEYLFPVSNPDYSKATYNIIEYSKQVYKPGGYIFGNNYALIYQLGINYTTYVSLYGEYSTLMGTDFDYVESKLKEGGYVILLDFPYLPRDGNAWSLLMEYCYGIPAYSNNKLAGVLFYCGGEQN